MKYMVKEVVVSNGEQVAFKLQKTGMISSKETIINAPDLKQALKEKRFSLTNGAINSVGSIRVDKKVPRISV